MVLLPFSLPFWLILRFLPCLVPFIPHLILTSPVHATASRIFIYTGGLGYNESSKQAVYSVLSLYHWPFSINSADVRSFDM